MTIPQRRKREREARRQSILDAAERVIARQGLWSTTMEDVASEAEVSKGTLYLYFSNRDALCAAVAERAIEALVPDLERAMTHADSGLARLKALLDSYREFVASHSDLFRMAISWMVAGVQCEPDDPDFVEYRRALARVTELVIGAIELGQSDGSIRAGVDARLLAVQLYAGLIGTFLFQLNREDMFRRIPFEVDTDALAPMYLAHMMRGIEGSQTP